MVLPKKGVLYGHRVNMAGMKIDAEYTNNHIASNAVTRFPITG